MHTKKIFHIAVLALAMTACSSDDNTLQQPKAADDGIPFSATISSGATTRAITENTTNHTLASTWSENDQVALIHDGVVDVMSITDIDNDTKTATITGSIKGSPVDGAAVTLVYPAPAVDATTKAVKTDLLNAQDGSLTTISTSLDLQQSEGAKLKVAAGHASLDGTVALTPQLAIVKFSLIKDGGTAIKATKLTISDGSKTITVTPTDGAGDLYVAMAPASGATYDFSATVGTDTYTYSKAGVTLTKGKYYQSPITMTIVQNPAEITFEKDADSKTWSPTAADNTYQQTLKTNTGDAIPAYSVNTDNTCGATIDASTGVVTFTKAGTVTVTATVADTEHYTYAIKSVCYTLIVNKLAGTISFATATPKEALHTDAADNTYTQEVTNTGHGTVTYTISDNTCGASIDASTGKVTFTQAGSVTITASVAEGTNYSYATKTATYTLSVSDTTDGSGGVPDTMITLVAAIRSN